MARENFNLPDGLAERLTQEAEARDVTKTALFASALDLLFAAIDTGSAQPLSEGAPPSDSHELVVALSGLGLTVRVLAPGKLGDNPVN